MHVEVPFAPDRFLAYRRQPGNYPSALWFSSTIGGHLAAKSASRTSEPKGFPFEPV